MIAPRRLSLQDRLAVSRIRLAILERRMSRALDAISAAVVGAAVLLPLEPPLPAAGPCDMCNGEGGRVWSEAPGELLCPGCARAVIQPRECPKCGGEKRAAEALCRRCEEPNFFE